MNTKAVVEAEEQATSPPWWRKILGILREHLTTFVTTTVVALLAVFSGQITETVKFALNRADARSDKYNSIAVELSNFVFTVELQQEFLANDWTTLDTLKWLNGDYNTAITSLRKNEYVYLQWLSHYWDQSRVSEFQDIMKTVKSIDTTIHSLNEQCELVTLGKSQKIDKDRAAETARQLEPRMKELQEKTNAFLTKLLLLCELFLVVSWRFG